MTPRAPLLSRCACSALVLVGVVLGSSGANAQPQRQPYRVGLLNNSFTPGSPTVKGLRVAKELMPNLRRVLVVYDAQDSASAAAARKAQETAPSLKLNVVVRAVRTQEEAVRELKTASARDVLLAPATMNLNIMDLI